MHPTFNLCFQGSQPPKRDLLRIWSRKEGLRLVLCFQMSPASCWDALPGSQQGWL